jgi:mRNA interferase MazF
MAKAQTLVRPRRGEVYLVNFDPSIGREIRKTRPALIVQNDIANRWSPITIVGAITSSPEWREYPTVVSVEPGEGGLAKPSRVLLNQVRSIDKQRLVKRMGSLSPITMVKVDQALRISLGLVELS